MKRILVITCYISITLFGHGQIIADHTVVDLYDDIPANWIDSVKKMVFTIAGESHRVGYYTGCENLEAINSLYAFAINSYPSAGNKTGNLTAAYALWGDYDNETGWVGAHGEEDWFSNDIARSRIIANLDYCNDNGYPVNALGFGWCYDAEEGNMATMVDLEYGVRWCGVTISGPEGNRAWGLDAGDYDLTGNSVSMDTYLSSTQQYIDYCEANSIPTVIFFTTGPVDSYASSEIAYQAYLKWEHLRDYVNADPSRILFDYADILCYDDDGTPGTTVWNGHVFPHITETNAGLRDVAHIGTAGVLRLGKALWWLMARIAGWDGTINGEDNIAPSIPSSLVQTSASETSISISWNAASDNVGVTGYNIYRDGGFLDGTSSLTYTDNSITSCGTYSYTVSSLDAAGNESARSSSLVVTNCIPDVTPTLIVTPNISHGIANFDVIVRVTELNQVNTNGDIVVNIPIDSRWDLNGDFNQALTLLDGFPVNNASWTHTSDETNHIFTFSSSINGGGFSAFGFSITFNPDVNRGIYTITTQVVAGGGGETRDSNNADSERLDYFQ